MYGLAVVGGGAAGIFAAIRYKALKPAEPVVVLEQSNNLLAKVRISGGGRCNVTNSCTDPADLIRFYPRGSKELLSVFRQFGPADTVRWFQENGVRLKTEADGRMFPVTDRSETIISCFLDLCKTSGVRIKTGTAVTAIRKTKNFELETSGGVIHARHVLVATGSSTRFWNILKQTGHTIVEPVPSLFTLNIRHPLLEGLQGVGIKDATLSMQCDPDLLKSIKISRNDLVQKGPVLITHWGLSGPAVLRLSAFGARLMNKLNYRFDAVLNFCDIPAGEVTDTLNQMKIKYPRRQVSGHPLFGLPARFWQRACILTVRNEDKTWAEVSSREIYGLTELLTRCVLPVHGKSTFKEEFVTAGGVSLKEVNFKTMESKLVPGLYFAGEVLDVDAVTGGFNFQAAWSQAWIAADAISRSD